MYSETGDLEDTVFVLVQMDVYINVSDRATINDKLIQINWETSLSGVDH